MKKVEVSSAARSAARILREEILSSPEGQFLGSEDELMEKLGVSRPTFRQAARLLDHEQLLTVKRGVGGGFFSRRPSIETVAHSVAIYLRSRDTTLTHMIKSNRAFFVLAVQAAASCRDDRLLKQLHELRDRLQATEGQDISARTLLDDEVCFTEIIGQMSENPAIELCLHMFNQFGMENKTAIWQAHPERIAKWRRGRRELIDSILAHDHDKAEVLSRELNLQIVNWVAEDDKKRSPAKEVKLAAN